MNELRITATRYHDISCGHRVVGHEGKCALMHGHNYRIHFTCIAMGLDSVGRVVDFSVIKERLCLWLEENWDHKFVAWTNDELVRAMLDACSHQAKSEAVVMFRHSLVFVPFNPTAENMALYLLHVVGPRELEGTDVTLLHVRVEETRKCSAEVGTR